MIATSRTRRNELFAYARKNWNWAEQDVRNADRLADSQLEPLFAAMLQEKEDENLNLAVVVAAMYRAACSQPVKTRPAYRPARFTRYAMYCVAFLVGLAYPLVTLAAQAGGGL